MLHPSLLHCVLLASALATAAAEPPLIRHLAPGQASPPATLADLDWLIGQWSGALDDNAQEAVVLTPHGAQLPGFARAWQPDGTPLFYEINAFVAVAGSVEFRVKHFSGDFVGWEPRDDYVRHRLVAVEGNTWYFDGITFVNNGPDRHDVHVLLTSGDRAGEIVAVQQYRRPTATTSTAPSRGTVERVPFTSTILAENRTGLSPQRTFMVYLPPSYATSPDRHYPVVYFCHSLNWSGPQMFADGNLQHLLEQGFHSGTVGEFIFVAADYTSPTMGSLYENSPITGRWLDYSVDEVVPFIDRTYRTIATSDRRAVVGDFMGGRGALALGLTHPDVFGTVYALHPVATGLGDLPWDRQDIDWAAIQSAPTFDALPTTGRERIFLMINQAYLPNPARPPFYCDFFIERENGRNVIHPDRVREVQRAFSLDEWLDANADHLRQLRGIGFDWGRFDSTQAHVISNRQFSRRLSDLGIEHEAEEYAGGPWDRTWTANGRFATRLLPFLARHVAGLTP